MLTLMKRYSYEWSPSMHSLTAKMSSAQHDTRAELAELLKRRNELTVRRPIAFS